jgi:hypothetical protein
MDMSGQRHASAALYPGEEPPATNCIGGWVGLRAVLDTTDTTGKILCLCGDRTPVVQSVVGHKLRYPSQYYMYCCSSILFYLYHFVFLLFFFRYLYLFPLLISFILFLYEFTYVICFFLFRRY